MQLVERSINPLSSDGGKILSGIFAEMDTFNQNGRRYPSSIYEEAVSSLLPKIQSRRLLGELDHPLEYDEVRLTNVSHVITECHMVEDGDSRKYVGSVELLDTPAGLIAQALVRAGVNLGISSRGLGSTKQVRDGVDVTQLNLITYDLVAEPSFSNSILTPDKTNELSDSLKYIESSLPLNESIETRSVRDKIHSIRESLIMKNTSLDDKLYIKETEIKSLRGLLESAQSTINSDTESMKSSRSEIKTLKKKLNVAKERYNSLLESMQQLQESYSELKENYSSNDEVEKLSEEMIQLRKELAVERRGMSYDKVSTLLEGAITEEEIDRRLTSLSSVSKKRQSQILIKGDSQTLDNLKESKRLTGLASIISRV